MSSQLMKFQHPIAPTNLSSLERALIGGSRPGEEAVEPLVDIEPLEQALSAIDPEKRETALDQAMVRPIYETLRIPRREAARPEVWQWLCVVAFPEITWRRWMGSEFPPDETSLSKWLNSEKPPTGLPARYLGKATVGALARNSFARLWWAAEALDGDFDLIDAALGNSDLFVGIFERQLGLNPMIAKACVRQLAPESGAAVKATLRGLQQRAKTTRLEFLGEARLEELVEELKP
jgi:hypothetical protein